MAVPRSTDRVVHVLAIAQMLLTACVLIASAQNAEAAVTCHHTVTARVVALEQVYQYNRFGAFNPEGLVYALQDDVEATVGRTPGPGNARLRSYKRPRPLVLRVNEGDCLQVTFRNWLSPLPPVQTGLTVPRHSLFPANNSTEQVPYPSEGSNHPATRHASIHVNGLDYVTPPAVAGCLTGTLRSDGAFVGNNRSSLVPPGGCAVYKWYAKKEGGFLLYSMGAHSGGEGDGAQPGLGLFGSVNVEPAGSRWYRSQVTAYDLAAAAKQGNGTVDYTKIHYAQLAIADSSHEIRHSDLNAIIQQTTGAEDCDDQGPTGTCGMSFREFTVIFHDELNVQQAFAELSDGHNPISAIRDGMGINYGSSSMGAAVLANAKGIGPARNCVECKFEEFFLSSWPNGDPALLVQYSDDPSNVHHSYLGDPVRFRNLHAGPKETHVFHLHAHQWLQDENDQNSTYLDSQTISPGAAYTYEIQYGGGGNRNFTVGDSIFHCHLYPHFAQGMWELWRNHDVFEDGTAARNLPDAEIANGTPNPALVPIPGFALPPRPTPLFRGYPFYVAAQTGHRPPQPPLDMDDAYDGGLPRHIITSGTAHTGAQLDKNDLFKVGGELSEFIARRVDSRNSDPNLTAFAKELQTATIEPIPREGSAEEQTAMAFHAGLLDLGPDAWWGVAGVPSVPGVNRYRWPQRGYPTVRAALAGGTPPAGNPRFAVNGRPQRSGAPYADPCPDKFRIGTTDYPVHERDYRAAYIQFDLTVNKWGWHDPQARIAVLERDIAPTLDRTRPAEPLFFRANSGDCIEFHATNLVPSALNLDDFQIYSPTDTLGQHIHLVKFDVTSSDGSGNGWNYEDGTFSADEVRERIEAFANTSPASPLTLKTNPLFQAGGAMAGDARGLCADAGGSDDNIWCGAQTTIQRWWADPLLNRGGRDRTIRSVFTHDHFGPSSHQHHGLYAALLVEPFRSTWTFLDGQAMGGSDAEDKPIVMPDRDDGGPTSYAGNVIARHDKRDTRREFNLAFADFAIVYTKELEPVNPPSLDEDSELPLGIENDLMPTPEGISTTDPGTQLINYRNEPVGLRVAKQDDDDDTYSQKPCPGATSECEGDMANAFSSEVHESADAELLQRDDPEPTGNAVLDGLRNALEDRRVLFNQQLRNVPWWKPGDPATPITAAYDGDPVLMRLIQGAQEEQHLFTMHGVRWLFQPSSPNSGFVNAQQIGISEHMEFDVPMSLARADKTDYLYSASAVDNRWDGMWGLLRDFGWVNGQVNLQPGLMQFPASVVKPPQVPVDANPGQICPAAAHANRLIMHVGAWRAAEILNDGSPRQLTYNERFGITDPNAIVFVEQNPRFNRPDLYRPRAEILADLRHTYGAGRKPLEPLILRAPAGSCIQVTLHNYLPKKIDDAWREDRSYAENVARASYNLLPPILEGFNFNQMESSSQVGLHPQLLATSLHHADGARVGFNEISTVLPAATEGGEGSERPYVWYAGSRDLVDCAVVDCPALRTVGKCVIAPATDGGGTRRLVHCPVEFGAVALFDMADVIKHASHGAVGMLIVEPPKTCASYPADPDHPEGTLPAPLTAQERGFYLRAGYCTNTPAGLQKQYLRAHGTADVRKPPSSGSGPLSTLFRDFAVLYQDDVSMQQHGLPMPNLADEDDPEDSGQKAFNYRSEPLWARVGMGSPAVSLEELNDADFTNVLSSKAFNPGCRNATTGLPEWCGDPATPLFRAVAGTEVRFRVVEPGGHPRQHGFTVFGHSWDFVPWSRNSTVIGSNGKHTFKVGSYSGIGPMRHLNVRVCAGGENALPGDYLYRTQESFQFMGGLWGIFRVTPRPPGTVAPCAAADPFVP